MLENNGQAGDAFVDDLLQGQAKQLSGTNTDSLACAGSMWLANASIIMTATARSFFWLYMSARKFASIQGLKDAASTHMGVTIGSSRPNATCLQSIPDCTQVWSPPNADCLSCQARHNPSLLRKVGILFRLDSIALLFGVIAQGKNDLGQHCGSACKPCLGAC